MVRQRDRVIVLRVFSFFEVRLKTTPYPLDKMEWNLTAFDSTRRVPDLDVIARITHKLNEHDMSFLQRERNFPGRRQTGNRRGRESPLSTERPAGLQDITACRCEPWALIAGLR